MKFSLFIALILAACTPRPAPSLAVPPLAITHPIPKSMTSALAEGDAAKDAADHYVFSNGSTKPANTKINHLIADQKAAVRHHDVVKLRAATKALNDYLGTVQ